MQDGHYQAATTTAGIGGPGFLVFAKYMEWQLPSGVVIFIGAVSCLLLLYSGIVYAHGVWGWVRRIVHARPQIREIARRSLIPVLIGVGVLASVALVAVFITAALMYRNGAFDPPPPQVQVVVPRTTANAPQTPEGLLPNPTPPPPGTDVERVSRYIQMTGLINDAKQIREDIKRNGDLYEQYMLAPAGTLTRSTTQLGLRGYNDWKERVQQLKSINERAYLNRAMDMETVPELANPLKKAPGEEAITDPDAAYKFRAFYYLNRSVQKQADALIDELQREKSTIWAAIKTSPMAKLIQEQQ